MFRKESNFMIKSNCHTHTIYCDGKNTPEEMVKAAIDEGFISLGFSVHSPLTYENDYSITEEKLPEYLEEIKHLKEKYKDIIEIYSGIELDSDHCNYNRNDYDFIIASVHQLHAKERIYAVDYTAEELKTCVDKEFGGDFLSMVKSYFSSAEKFICDVKPDVIGHIDLFNKFNENKGMFDYTSAEYKLMAQMYIEKICYACPDSIFEVNTGAMFRCGNKRPYPSKFILKLLKRNNMKITITSDAHCTSALSYGFDNAVQYCKDCGYEEAYILKDTQFQKVSL